ncbi:MAG: FecR domain-containing protein [Myxococcales bacterium]
MNERPRLLPAQIAAVIAAGVLAALLVFRFAVYEPPREPVRPAPAKAAATPPLQAVVLSVQGEVEKGREGGSWSKLHPGESVRVDAVLRTGADGHTDLALGERARVSIGESTEVAIRELTDSVHRFRLTRGRMLADYDRDGERVLRVEDGTGETVAETKSARFGVLSTGTGIAVATTSGGVDLRTRRQGVHVATGEQSFAPEGGAPTPPAPIPTSVLLKVGNALAEGGDETLCAEIDGEAAAGSEVKVDGVAVPLDATGHFHERVLRKPGQGSVVVAIRDPSGREKTRNVACAPPPAQIRDMAIRWKTR